MMSNDEAIAKISDIILKRIPAGDKEAIEALTIAVHAIDQTRPFVPIRNIDRYDNMFYKCAECGRLVFYWQNCCENCGHPINWRN